MTDGGIFNMHINLGACCTLEGGGGKGVRHEQVHES